MGQIHVFCTNLAVIIFARTIFVGTIFIISIIIRTQSLKHMGVIHTSEKLSFSIIILS